MGDVFQFPSRAPRVDAPASTSVPPKPFDVSDARQGSRVIALRQWLGSVGFKPEVGVKDAKDVYDEALAAAVAALQAKLGVKPTGVWDEITYRAATADLALPNTALRPVEFARRGAGVDARDASTPTATPSWLKPVALIAAGVGLFYLLTRPKTTLSVSGLENLRDDDDSGDDQDDSGDDQDDAAVPVAPPPPKSKKKKRGTQGIPDEPPL